MVFDPVHVLLVSPDFFRGVFDALPDLEHLILLQPNNADQLIGHEKLFTALARESYSDTLIAKAFT